MKPIPDQNAFESYFFGHSNQETADRFNVCKTTIFQWARKFGTKRKTNQYKDILQSCSGRQIEIITGSLLGDCSLGKVTNKEQSYFRELHGEKQKDYIHWKYTELQPFSIHFGKCINNKKFQGYLLRTMRHPFFTTLEQHWYKRNNDGTYVLRKDGKRIKIVPDNLELTPLTLAIWYFDDGWRQGKQFFFCTYGFSKHECEKLVEKMRPFNITCYVRLRNKQLFPEIGVVSNSYFNFVDLVKPFLPCECMAYKIP